MGFLFLILSIKKRNTQSNAAIGRRGGGKGESFIISSHREIDRIQTQVDLLPAQAGTYSLGYFLFICLPTEYCAYSC